MKYIFIPLLALFVVGCTNKSTSSKSESNYKKIAKKVFNDNAADYIFNNSDDYVLAIYNSNDSNVPGNGVTNFLVINTYSDEIVAENSIPNGKVKWVSDYEIQIVSPPGMIKDSSDTLDNYTEILNVKTGKKIKKFGAQF